MTTTITKSFHVDHPVDAVWNNLTNPTQVVTCVPECLVDRANRQRQLQGGSGVEIWSG